MLQPNEGTAKIVFSGLSSSSTNTLPLPWEVTVKTEETNEPECDSDSDTEELLNTKSLNYKDLTFTKFSHYARKKTTCQPQLHQRFPKSKNSLNSKRNIPSAPCVNQLIIGLQVGFTKLNPQMMHGCHMKLYFSKQALIIPVN